MEKYIKNGCAHMIVLWSYRGPEELDQTGLKSLAPLSKGIHMKYISFEYLIAMVSISLLWGIWYLQTFFEIVNGLCIQLG